MQLGFHVSKSGRKISDAILADLKSAGLIRGKTPAVQIFAVGPRKVNARLTGDDLEEIRQKITGRGVARVVIHGSYFDHPWDLSAEKIHLYLHIIRDEIRAAAACGAEGVVVHLGKKALDNPAEVFRRLATGISDEILASCVLFLEINAAKPGPNSYETPEKINAAMEKLSTWAVGVGIQLGLCVDTAHLHSCGTSLGSRESAEKWLGGLVWKGPLMFHLNDNVGGFGSGRDIHADIGAGDLFTGGAANGGLRAILEFAEKNKCMVIIERDDPQKDIRLIMDLGY